MDLGPGYVAGLDGLRLRCAGASARGGELITEVACVETKASVSGLTRAPSATRSVLSSIATRPSHRTEGSFFPGPPRRQRQDLAEAACAVNPAPWSDPDCRKRVRPQPKGHLPLRALCARTWRAEGALSWWHRSRNAECRLNNHDFRIPKSSSGAGDLWGGDVLVTLGLWSATNFIGTDHAVASTTFHEIGHNLGLWHGGAAATITPVVVGRW